MRFSKILMFGVSAWSACLVSGCKIEEREYSDVDAAVRPDSAVHLDAASELDAQTADAKSETPDAETADASAADAEPGESADAAETDGSLPPLPDGAIPECVTKKDCDDKNVCNGDQICFESHCFSDNQKLDDGESCGADDESRICVVGSCVASRCGDGLPAFDDSEECDDANDVANDGCEENCKYSCSDDKDCPDAPLCLEATTCQDHICVLGAHVDDLTECGGGLVCSAGNCVPEGCGNSQVEAEEECDDGNAVANDGCTPTCTYSCTKDSQCDNLDLCDGVETCDTVDHVCVAGEVPDCTDSDPCTVNSCDPALGCVTGPVDADRDGHSPEADGCGDDCNDEDDTVYSGAPELCDQKDNDCNERVDEKALNWYVDCDGDGFAALNAIPQTGCEIPPSEDCGAGLAGTWTTRVPSSAGESDCWDKDPNVHPRTATEDATAWNSAAISGRSVGEDFDYNCVTGNESRWTATSVSTTAYCGSPIIVQPVAVGSLALAELQQLSSGIGVIQLCTGSAGWTGASAPGCGKSGNYTNCSSASGSCARVSASKTQECR